MVNIELVDFERVRDNWRDFSERRFNSAVAAALTRTALNAKANVQQEMRQVFDRPTPWIIDGLWVQTATADPSKAGTSLMGSPSGATRVVGSAYMSAMVYFKNDAASSGLASETANELLKPQVFGGVGRAHKRGERALMDAHILPQGWYAIPGPGAKLNAYGNMPGSEWVKVISGLRAFVQAGRGYNINRTDRSKARRPKMANYFVSHPNDVKRLANGGRLPFGVYQLLPSGKITTILRFRPRVSYRPRLDFFGIVERTVRNEMPGQLQLALRQSWARQQSSRLPIAA